MKCLFYLVAIFLINLPTPIPTKRNSVKPRNVIGNCMKALLLFIFICFSTPALAQSKIDTVLKALNVVSLDDTSSTIISNQLRNSALKELKRKNIHGPFFLKRDEKPFENESHITIHIWTTEALIEFYDNSLSKTQKIGAYGFKSNPEFFMVFSKKKNICRHLEGKRYGQLHGLNRKKL